MNSFSDNFWISWALLKRDFFVMKKNIRSIWIDSAVVLFLQVILFGSLMPQMGISIDLVAPFFIGGTFCQLFFKATGKAYHAVSDLKFNRFIDYRITLPLPKRWLYAQEICSWVMEIMIGMTPFIIIGIPAMGRFFSLSILELFSGVVMLAFCSILCSVLSLSFCYYYGYTYFINNIWPRRLGWIYCLAPMFFLWKQAYAFSPRVAQIIFLNPLTPCIEGLRAVLFQTDQYVSLTICLPFIVLYIIFFSTVLARGIKRRLDPV